MDRIIEIQKIVLEEVEQYAGEGLNAQAYLLSNSAQNTLAVLDVAEINGQHLVDTGLFVRIEGDRVIIEKDLNNKPLLEALLQRGLNREQIILRYAGETISHQGSSGQEKGA